MDKPTKSKPATLTVNEIYASVQGESTWAGLPCTFIRLTYCDLRCSWCDTEYAFYEGDKMPLEDIIAEVKRLDIPLVEVTGGEPLLQPATPELMQQLCDAGFEVLVETGGHRDISVIDSRVRRIVDMKCPHSGMTEKMRYENIPLLTRQDEVKFVIATREDYEWARDQVREYELASKVNSVLFSSVFEQAQPKDIVEWILEDQLPVRFQLQMHKFIWDPRKKGV
ncbi:MAG: radical SAM protein [Verrucomicrobiota bacterium]